MKTKISSNIFKKAYLYHKNNLLKLAYSKLNTKYHPYKK